MHLGHKIKDIRSFYWQQFQLLRRLSYPFNILVRLLLGVKLMLYPSSSSSLGGQTMVGRLASTDDRYLVAFTNGILIGAPYTNTLNKDL